MSAVLGRVPGWENTASLHGELKARERRERLLKFRSGDIPILTSVDILNEGVDIPDVNILCFVRVTHSRRIFVQQLGRGLRLRKGKTYVEVLDFVSDIRRLAELHDLREQVSEGLLEQWIADVGDLGGADESVRLEFPPLEGP
jgi:superfamily II DNA or RNA helicase